MKELNIGMIGYKFMGKAHSNAWKKVPLFFDVGVKPVLKAVCGRHQESVQEFADKWGWESVETDWRAIVEREDIDVIDVGVPTNLHSEIAIAAAKAGKHIFCEKPMAISYEDSKKMLAAAEEAGIVHYLNHNYRRVPAVRLAKQLIEEGKLGRLFHWRGCYLQSWIIDPEFPLTWHLKKEFAGAGPHYDLNSHSLDLARYLMGEVKSVMGMTKTFVKERPLPDEVAAGTFKKAVDSESAAKGEVTVDDAAAMMVEFENGAMGTFESSRFCQGRKNFNHFEIYGEKGSIAFDLERMNELKYFNSEDPENAQGFRTILATEACHDYIENWWPPGHIIGYEHEFVHAAADFLVAVSDNKQIEPNFRDGVKCMQVLDAALESAASGRRVDIK